jgi:hypothetical protein
MDTNSRCRYQNNLPAAHRVFLNCPCQKSYGRKIPARNNRYGRKIPASNYSYLPGFSGLTYVYRYGRKIRLPVTADTAGKSRQVTTWYGRKIRLPVTADTAGKSRQVTTRYGRKIRLPVTTETAGKSPQETDWVFSIMYTRLPWRSGRTLGSYSEGRKFAPPLCSNIFPLHRRKIPVAQKIQHKIQAPMLKTFFALCTKWVSGTRSW